MDSSVISEALRLLVEKQSQDTSKPSLGGLGSTYTENGALAFESTNSNCLDLFFKMVRDTPQSTIEQLFYDAWLENPNMAMQVLLHCRDCRKGKGERLITQYALLWLRKYKPRTYLKNIMAFLGAGYYKDFLSIVKHAENDSQPKMGKLDMIELEIFAEQLRKDECNLQNNLPISLAAKWAPTECHSDDRNYETASRLANILFPSPQHRKSFDSQHLKQYRLLLSKLRRHIKVVESQMAHNQWSEIEYQKVPAKSHHLHKAAFKKHDTDRYEKYIQDVLQNKTQIKSTGVQPHELTKPFMKNVDPENKETLQAQWNDMITQLKKTTKLSCILPLCDVSGSMEGEPMEVCIALGLLISELVEGPFANTIMTFETNPKLVKLKEKELGARVKELKKAPWGGSTNLEAAFDQLLSHAVMMGCSQEQLPKVIVIFSDMQFNEASNVSKTLFEVAKDKFAQEGYKLPSVVFWNLRDTQSSFPVTKTEDGVSLLSGYSASLVKELMEDPENICPMKMLYHVLEPYTTLVSIDEDELGPIGDAPEMCSYQHPGKDIRRKPRGKGPGSARRPKPKKPEADNSRESSLMEKILQMRPSLRRPCISDDESDSDSELSSFIDPSMLVMP